MDQDLIEYFNGDDFAASTWKKKYAAKGEKTPEDTHRRMAKEFARKEKEMCDKWNGKAEDLEDLSELGKKIFKSEGLKEDEIFKLFDHFKYVIPGGSVMASLGTGNLSSLSNCFVIESPEDSYQEIMKVRSEQVQLMKRRGGVGYDLSKLRPRGSKVNNSAKTSTGAASFMQVNSDITNEVAQNGRRGALMLTMSINHPDIEEFITKKQDLTKVTGANISVKVNDEFMKAVEEDKDYFLRWPVDSNLDLSMTKSIEEYDKLVAIGEEFKPDKRIYLKKVKAKRLWDILMHCAWNTAEPGIIFETRMHDYAPDGVYDEFKMVSTNPCLTKETKVLTADGRGLVEIGKLAEEGKDVPVFCLNDKGKIEVQTMRNPRVTGYNEKIYKVTLEGGHVIRCTGNHKFLTTDGIYKEVKDMIPGESLKIFYEVKSSINDELSKDKENYIKQNKYFTIRDNKNFYFEHRLIAEHSIGHIPIGYIVHHKDHNTFNNNINNLQILSTKEHNILHGYDMQGKNNPIYKIKANPKRFEEYSKKISQSTSGEKNPRYRNDISLDDLIDLGIELCKKLNRGFSKSEYYDYRKEKLNFGVSKFRDNQLFVPSFKDFVNYCIEKSGIQIDEEYWKKFNKDSRIYKNNIKRYNDAIKQGYEVKIENDIVLVKKICEYCQKEFWVPYIKREISVCSRSCANYKSSKYRKYSIKEYYKKIANDKNEKLLKAYTQIKFNLGRPPKYKELESYCRDKKIPCRLGTKYGFKSWNDLVEAGNVYNHRIISIEEDGYENVYNGTVDKYHNFFVGGWNEPNEKNDYNILMINNLNCGEIPLPGNYDSCRLIHLNLSQMIDNPYKKEARLNKDLLYDVAYMTTFLADDLVDLEYEAVSKIAEACKNDKYPLEYNLWNKIKETGLKTRRCGIGFTGLADAIAKLGLRYCSSEGNRKVEEIMKTMFEATLRAEIDLSILRGTFSGYDKTVEDSGNSWFEFLKQEYPDLFDQMKKHGRRNISWTTVAPTGTVSIMAGCSSGIEPIFLPFYERKRKCMSPDDPVDFIDKVGEKFSVFVIVHPELKRYAQDILGISYENQEHMKISEWQKIYEESPWMKSCAPDIDWHNRVELQGIVQDEFCTHSVSSTVNLLNETTEEEIKDIYVEAWKHGLKGITIYRDGCRDGVMTKMNDSKSETIEVARAPKRPKELPADFYMVRVKGERFAVIVGMFDNKPYEVFAYKMPDGSESIKNHTGKIMKIAKGHYKFVSNPDSSTPITVDNLLLANENVEEKACTLYCSMLLRHGINIKYVIKTSKKVNENITSFSSALCRVLSKYLPVEKKYDTCPECGGRLVRDAGCVRCLDCTYSKCL